MTRYNAYGKLNMDTQRKAVICIGEGNADLQNISTEALLKEMIRRAVK